MATIPTSKNRKYLFTSESVSEGHPDKLCDQISDAILDYVLSLDKYAHVACESFATTNFVAVCGEIGFSEQVDGEKCSALVAQNAEKIARSVAREVGYTDEKFGLNCDTFEFMNRLHTQSADIAQGVDG
ncbi:MAG: S-adenosylmethionine synthetase N-terminal domain-containing protein, partial [Spirochaetales bacterium]|nr:S-adenosylmethionine synthetase N-terminal domain-containing protein [Spirochaetales bacterium]